MFSAIGDELAESVIVASVKLLKSCKGRASRTPWHFVPRGGDFALALAGYGMRSRRLFLLRRVLDVVEVLGVQKHLFSTPKTSAFQLQWNRPLNRASIDDQLNLD